MNSYSAGLFQLHADSSLDKMLKPVLSLDELVKGTFYCDGGYLYINPFDTDYKSFVALNGGNDLPVIKITNCKNVLLEDLDVKYSYYESFVIRNCMDVTVRNCTAGYNILSSSFNITSTNGNFYNCKAMHARKDGYGIGDYGVTNFYNCDGLYCMDDGMSHHFGCVGNVYGGSFIGNGKGGNAPCYGAKVSMYNCFFKDNRFGVYVVSASDRIKGVEIPLFNCVFENNIRDAFVDMAKVLLINCVKKGSTEPDSGNIVVY